MLGVLWVLPGGGRVGALGDRERASGDPLLGPGRAGEPFVAADTSLPPTGASLTLTF
jgi:hypothetical protein